MRMQEGMIRHDGRKGRLWVYVLNAHLSDEHILGTSSDRRRRGIWKSGEYDLLCHTFSIPFIGLPTYEVAGHFTLLPQLTWLSQFLICVPSTIVSNPH